MRPNKSTRHDIEADPFHERVPPASRVELQLLGAAFEFECGSSRLRQLVDRAYAKLPRHVLYEPAPRVRISLLPAPVQRTYRRTEPPRIGMLSGGGLLCGSSGCADFAVIGTDQKTALIVVSHNMLRFPYNARYELVEFAVFTLAMRTQGLIPLHGACIGQNGRALLLMGESGAGKSTAAFYGLWRGMEFVSEDSVFVTPDARRATGIANFLHVRCDSLRALPRAWTALIRRSPVIRRRSGVRKYEIDLRQPQFQLASTAPNVAGVIFMSKQRARQQQLLRPLPRREALARMRECQGYAASQPGWAAFSAQIGSIPAFELYRGRHAEQSAEVLQQLLADAGPAA